MKYTRAISSKELMKLSRVSGVLILVMILLGSAVHADAFLFRVAECYLMPKSAKSNLPSVGIWVPEAQCVTNSLQQVIRWRRVVPGAPWWFWILA
jgi:hypothetical protein